MKHLLDLHRSRRMWRDWDRRRAPFGRRRARAFRFGRNELAGMLLAGIVGGLAWTMLPAAAPAAGDGLAGFARVEPESWTESRRSRAILAEQEAAPASLYAPSAPSPPARGTRVTFGFCHSGGGGNCVVDGDTFRMGDQRIRIADIDTPETHPPRCAREAELGAAATRRLHALLNGGAVTLRPIDRDADRYGRKLRLVEVDGHGIGATLIAEGLARPYRGGPRAGWCA